MGNLTTTYSNRGLNESMLDELELNIKVTNNPFNFELGDLFLIGARKNPKRNFLFVSKLIGKHISVKPEIPLLTGQLLGSLFAEKRGYLGKVNRYLLSTALKGAKDVKGLYQMLDIDRIDLEKPTLVLGFAETATGLGHSVFQSFGKNAHYIHTTREDILELTSSFNFEEEHSHATSHMCYGMEKDFFNKFEHIVLVDDEVTTGNTALNLIKSLNEQYPNKNYSVLSLLDWRQKEDVERTEQTQKDLGIDIDFVSLVSGEVSYTNKELSYPETVHPEIHDDMIVAYDHFIPVSKDLHHHYLAKAENGTVSAKSYLSFTGRFGMDEERQKQLDLFAKQSGELLAGKREYSQSLCLGTGEFMHIPCLIATHMGEDILYHSTTRSPIHTKKDFDYPVNDSIQYVDERNPSVDMFIYNVQPNQYKEVFFFTEQRISQKEKDHLAFSLSKKGVKFLHLVSFDYEGHSEKSRFEELHTLVKSYHEGYSSTAIEDIQNQIQTGHKNNELSNWQCDYLFGLLEYGNY